MFVRRFFLFFLEADFFGKAVGVKPDTGRFYRDYNYRIEDYSALPFFILFFVFSVLLEGLIVLRIFPNVCFLGILVVIKYE